MNLLARTVELAKTTQLSHVSICQSIGVTTRWYQKVLSGEIAEPSVVKIQRLHDFLLAASQTSSAA